MDDLVKEIIPLLQYLIPGFLSAWVFYSLTAFKRPDTFGQIVQALMTPARAPQLMPKQYERLFKGSDGKPLEEPLIKAPSAPPPLKYGLPR